MELKEKDYLLYAVTDRRWLNKNSSCDTLPSQVEKSIKGGTTFVQLREKDLDYKSFKSEALEIKKICKSYKVPFVINDNVELAIDIDADGVHVGQNDMDSNKVRQLIGKEKILGVSAQTVEQAILAEKQGADYLGVGAVFNTTSKDDAVEVSYETLKEICNAVKIPVVAIGGITEQNLINLKNSGIKGIAVISALFGQKDITEAAKKLKSKTQEMLG